MTYLEQVRASDEHNRYRLMYQQVEAATAVCAGKLALDPQLFSPVPVHNESPPSESEGSLTELKDVIYAFASGLYAPSYGRVSSRQRFEQFEPVAHALHRWNTAITDSYQASVTPAAFRRIFFEGGLWQVFIDRYTPEAEDMRSRIHEASDLSSLKKDSALRHFAAQYRPFFLRTPPGNPPSHSGSQIDAARFANAVLAIGQEELGLKEDDQEALLSNSLPELRRLTLLEMAGVNIATEFMYDGKRCRFKDEYLTIDDRRPHIGFDMPAIQNRIEELLPNSATYNHRGCPVVYQTTPHNGSEIPIFSAMNDTLVRIYHTTGALTIASLRLL